MTFALNRLFQDMSVQSQWRDRASQHPNYPPNLPIKDRQGQDSASRQSPSGFLGVLAGHTSSPKTLALSHHYRKINLRMNTTELTMGKINTLALTITETAASFPFETKMDFWYVAWPYWDIPPFLPEALNASTVSETLHPFSITRK